jgi:hypothetical protein
MYTNKKMYFCGLLLVEQATKQLHYFLIISNSTSWIFYFFYTRKAI